MLRVQQRALASVSGNIWQIVFNGSDPSFHDHAKHLRENQSSGSHLCLSQKRSSLISNARLCRPFDCHNASVNEMRNATEFQAKL